MKKLFTIIAIASSVFAISQKTNTTNAAMAYKSYEQAKMGGDWEQGAKDLLEAKGYIDQSAEHVDTKNDPKTLMYLCRFFWRCYPESSGP